MSNLREIIPAFFTGPQGQRLTPEQIQAREVIAADLMQQATDTSPNQGGVASILAKTFLGLGAGRNRSQATNAGNANAAATAENMSALTGSIGQGWSMPESGGAAMGGVPSVASGLVGSGAGVQPVSSAPLPSISDANDAVFSDRHPQSSPSPVPMTKGRQGFIDALLPAAIEHGARIGVDPRIIVAQAAQETGWGRSAPGNNYFGIKSHGKGGGQTFTTHEVINGKRVKIRDSFRQFASPADSVAGYAEFLTQNPRYKPMLAAGDLDSQLLELGRSGYATDPNYAKSVGAIARSIVLPNAGQSQPTTVAGAIATPDSALDPESRARMEGMRQPYDQANVVPASMPGSVSEAPDMIWDDQGFRPNQAALSAQPASLPQGGLPQGATYTPAQVQSQPSVAQALTMPPIPSVPPLDPRVQQTLSSPYATREEKSVAAGLLQQHQGQVQAAQQQYQQRQMAEYEQAVAQQQAAQALAQRQQVAQRFGIDPAFAADEIAFKAMVDQATRDPASYAPGSTIRNRDGTVTQIPFAPTGNMQDYDAYAADERRAGRTPPTRLEFAKTLKSSGATTINNVLGGEDLTPGQREVDVKFAPVYTDWVGGGYADSAKQLTQLDESLGIIERAAANGENISGIIGRMPDYIQPFINPQGTIAREGVEEVVQRSLREILGAQFTEKEGERLIARAYNPALPAEENAKRTRRLIGQIQSMAESRQEMAEYFEENGTLRGYKGRRPSLGQLQNVESQWEREDKRAGRPDLPETSSGNVPPLPANAPQGLDEVWDIMTPEERAKFQ